MLLLVLRLRTGLLLPGKHTHLMETVTRMVATRIVSSMVKLVTPITCNRADGSLQ